MARISRLGVPGYPHHVTQRGVRSIPIFSSDKDRSAYADIMAEQLRRFGVEVLAWCLMTNHTHFVAVVNNVPYVPHTATGRILRWTHVGNCST